jgi:hypothetical protein
MKHADFLTCASITRSMVWKKHFTRGGFERIVRLAYSMNEQGKQRKRDCLRSSRDPQRLHAKHPRASRLPVG